MTDTLRNIHQPVIEAVKEFTQADLDDLCEAAEEAIIDGNGFGWLTPPRRTVQENFWKGILMVPVRELYCARFEGRIVGSAQLVKPFSNNEAGRHIAQVATFFIAPYARGYGLAIGLLAVLENSAREQGFKFLEVDVRETQAAAISILEANGYEKWAVKPYYAWNGERYVDGYYYKKQLAEL